MKKGIDLVWDILECLYIHTIEFDHLSSHCIIFYSRKWIEFLIAKTLIFFFLALTSRPFLSVSRTISRLHLGRLSVIENGSYQRSKHWMRSFDETMKQSHSRIEAIKGKQPKVQRNKLKQKKSIKSVKEIFFFFFWSLLITKRKQKKTKCKSLWFRALQNGPRMVSKQHGTDPSYSDMK